MPWRFAGAFQYNYDRGYRQALLDCIEDLKYRLSIVDSKLANPAKRVPLWKVYGPGFDESIPTGIEMGGNIVFGGPEDGPTRKDGRSDGPRTSDLTGSSGPSGFSGSSGSADSASTAELKTCPHGVQEVLRPALYCRTCDLEGMGG